MSKNVVNVGATNTSAVYAARGTSGAMVGNTVLQMYVAISACFRQTTSQKAREWYDEAAVSRP